MLLFAGKETAVLTAAEAGDQGAFGEGQLPARIPGILHIMHRQRKNQHLGKSSKNKYSSGIPDF